MLTTSRLGQLLRQKPFHASLFRARARRTLTKSTPLRRRPDLLSPSYFTASGVRAAGKPARPWHAAYRDLLAQRFRDLRFNSTGPPKPNPTAHLGSPEPQGLRARLNKLFREYGWVALGVYLSLSLLDLPLCFLAVRLAGPERIGQIEVSILTTLKKVFAPVWDVVGPFMQPVIDKARRIKNGDELREGAGGYGKQDDGHHEAASIWTELALAYGIHKTLLIFLRVPLTGALTPKVAKTLRGWGYQIGKKKTKS